MATNRREFITYSAVVGSIGLAGCMGDDDSDAEYRTAVSIPNIEFQFFARQEREWDRITEERDIAGSFYDGQGSDSQQISDIETAITQDVDFLVVSPNTEEGTVPGVEQANAEDIPVVNMDRTIDGGEVATHVASDNVDMGRDATELCLELMEGVEENDTYNIIELQGTPGTSVANDRQEGFQNAVEDNDNLEELATQDADFSTSQAINVMEDFVTSYEDEIDGVYAHNDQMALGAQQVLEDNDYDGVPIVGIDGIDTWLEEVVDNDLYATIGQLPEKMLQDAIDYGIQAVEGEELDDFYQMEAPRLNGDDAQEYLDEYF